MLTFKELSDKYLLWCKSHQSIRTHQWYANYLNMFTAYPTVADTDAYQIKPYQVQEWIDSHGDAWGSTYRGGAVVAVKRVYNWAEEMGHGEGNPIKKLKKATAQSRKTYAKEEGVQTFIEAIPATDTFLDLITRIGLGDHSTKQILQSVQ